MKNGKCEKKLTKKMWKTESYMDDSIPFRTVITCFSSRIQHKNVVKRTLKKVHLFGVVSTFALIFISNLN